MSATPIEWTDYVWNPVRGCSRVSQGCVNCYAERTAARFAGPNSSATQWNSKRPFSGFVHIVNGHPAWTGKVELVEKHLKDPLHWKTPKKIFVNSMSDLFHEALPDEAIDKVFAVMGLSPWHTYQVLTKRPERMSRYLSYEDRDEALTWTEMSLFQNPGESTRARFACGRRMLPLPNVWLGVSVEDQKNKERIDILREVPAAVRFLSIEPLLEDIGELDLRGIHWVIVGGESGPKARPMPPEWPRSIRDQCREAGVPYFFKQFGQWSPVGNASKHKYRDVPVGDGTHRRMFSVGKKAAGRLLDGREWNEFPSPANLQRAANPVQHEAFRSIGK